VSQVTRRTIPLAALVVLALVASACSSSSSSSSVSPAQRTAAVAVLTASEKAVQAQTSLHFTDVTTIGNQKETITGQFALNEAEEQISTSKSSTLDVRLIGTTVYFLTNTSAVLQSVFSMTAAQASAAVNQWILVTSADSAYSSIAQTLTAAQAVGIYYPSKTTATLGVSQTIKGTKVVPLLATSTPQKGTTAHSTVNIATSTHLPVSGRLVATQGKSTEKKSATFESWGSPVNVVAPPSSTPLATFKA
jgi:hypothetical protein